jgi:hypothetical protein
LFFPNLCDRYCPGDRRSPFMIRLNVHRTPREASAADGDPECCFRQRGLFQIADMCGCAATSGATSPEPEDRDCPWLSTGSTRAAPVRLQPLKSQP